MKDQDGISKKKADMKRQNKKIEIVSNMAAVIFARRFGEGFQGSCRMDAVAVAFDIYDLVEKRVKQ